MDALRKKMDRVLGDPEHTGDYKTARYAGLHAAHVTKNYVLVWELEGDVVIFRDFFHHDEY
ncbi:MAG: hypothetical protein HY558_06325 [Euryarchaeota archaeon]|nr:hypothetical protein [Euryarchaeota archaeon]